MNAKSLCAVLNLCAVLILLLGGVASHSSRAQAGTPTACTTFQEDFTGASTCNNWYFYSGACLTAGTSTSTSSPGPVPACTTVLNSYYATTQNSDPALVGGNSGYLGSATAPSSRGSQVADPVGSGALRFTNGYPYGHQQRGAILSASTFPSDQGIQVTFKTVTYLGDGGGSGGDGADGISFFLMDGSKTPGLGSTGGSLAYTCTNETGNLPYDGVNGGYVGLGIDEYGNFLNGTNWASGYTGPNVASADNTASGYGFKPDRIGLRGAGSISWTALNGSYGTNPGSSILPYYPASLTTSCAVSGGVYSSATNNCIDVCPAGSTYDSTTDATAGKCVAPCATGTYDAATDTCNNCISVNGTYNPTTQMCTNTTSCASGSTYNSTSNACLSCPAAGYATPTNNATSGMCTNSCPTGYVNAATTFCIPTGAIYNSGYYCPSGSTITTNGTGVYVCYPTVSPANNYSAGYYCPSGQSVSGSHCYTTGDSKNTTTLDYCPSGQTINTAGTSCYPTASPVLSTNGTNYCPSGQTITGASCYTTGLSKNTTTLKYCPSGQTIDSSGTYCYPTTTPANVYGAGYYCPNGDTAPTALARCCVTGYTYNSGTGLCKQNSGGLTQAATAANAATLASAMSPATAMTPATPMTVATAATPATAATAAVTVAANPTATQITAPTAPSPPTSTPTSANVDALYAVQNTCKTGNLYNYGSPGSPVSAGPATLSNAANTAKILDYAPIAYKELTSFKIANESATTRAAATPIFYNLKITNSGLLSLSYSVAGGAYSYLINNQSITSTQGTPPATYRVGFAGSTGGSTNIHEIMCFKATSTAQSGSSATGNEKQAAKVQAGTQAYFAYYNPSDWTGTVTANTLTNNSDGSVSVSTTANWDASCLLTWSSTPASGGGCATTTGTGLPAPAARVMLTWDTANNIGIPFEWASLNSAQQAALTAGDSSLPAPQPPTQSRFNYLRGDRSNEIDQNGNGLFRARDAVLGDIVDSSPAWVGPPSSPYTATWQDRLKPTTVMKENSGQSYVQFVNAEQMRLNVVYVGANDGFVHGFEAGGFDNTGTFVTATTPNDGKEVLSYIPGSTLASAAASGATGGCTNDTTTGTVVQQIHGSTPAITMPGSPPTTSQPCVEPILDYSNTQYGHNFFVDATPGSGDLYYKGQWHTWLVGGLGAGGAAIYALDVTDPSTFAESHPGTVIGEWNPASITCTTSCGSSLGNTFGTPQIRRLHNGNWGVIFGNGLGSQTGDAGIYVMSVDSASGTATFYYLSTNPGATPPTGGFGNGIAYVTPADLDGDHITDYVYAGDLNGNVWRFDLTSNDPSLWGITNAAGLSVNAPSPGGGAAAPLFTTQSGQPITSQLLVISSVLSGSPRLLIEFGTGSRTQITNLGPETFASGTQALYGVWDWNLSNWNALQPGSAYLSLPGPYTLSATNLQLQTLTANASTVVNGAPPTVVDGTNIPVCWQGSTTACGSSNTEFGWYVNLIGGNPSIPGAAEQVIFNPVFFQGAFVVNSIVPANNLATTCTNNQDLGYTYAINVANGGVFTNTFPTFTMNGTVVTDSKEAGVETNATGSVYIVSNPGSKLTSNIIYQTLSGTPGSQQINIPSNTKAKRITWIEKR
jgi:type IV pilus assembly protein PilY1